MVVLTWPDLYHGETKGTAENFTGCFTFWWQSSSLSWNGESIVSLWLKSWKHIVETLDISRLLNFLGLKSFQCTAGPKKLKRPNCFCSGAWFCFVFSMALSMQIATWGRWVWEGKTSLPGRCFASTWCPSDLCLHNQDVAEKCLWKISWIYRVIHRNLSSRKLQFYHWTVACVRRWSLPWNISRRR